MIGPEDEITVGAREPVSPPPEAASAPPEEAPERLHPTRAEALGVLSGAVAAVSVGVGQAIADRIRGPVPPDRSVPVPGSILCRGCAEDLRSLRMVSVRLREHLEVTAEHDPWPLGLQMALDDVDRSLSNVAAGLRHLHAIQGLTAPAEPTSPAAASEVSA
jgi:hypothetical protein